jgi:carboxyl-terminal processing protease
MLLSTHRVIIWAFVISLLGSAGRAQVQTTQPTARDLYAKDVDFLLQELEKRAGHFFVPKSIDWPAVAAQFRSEVRGVNTDPEHIALCRRLMCRLRDGHAGLTDVQPTMLDEAQGKRFTGPCVHLIKIGDRVHVRQAFGAAAEAGLRPGTEVVRIDDQPVTEWLERTIARLSDRHGYSTPQMAEYYACHTGLADRAGTAVFIEVAAGGGQTIRLTRSGGSNFVPIGPVFPPKDIKTIGRQAFGKTAAGYGYIHLRDVPADLPQQLDTMLAAIGDVPGMILDFRANGGGGCDHAAVFGRFIAASKRWRQYQSAGLAPFAGPMVVIVDAGVRSAGETVAGQFKEDGRALMIGDSATAGMSSQKESLRVPSGLFTAVFSVASNKGRFNDGRGIEGIGVRPHIITAYDPEDLGNEIDSQIRQAEEMLRRGVPKDLVPWEAEARP